MDLRKIPRAWKSVASKYVPTLVEAFKKQGLTDPYVLAYACATICYESSWNPNAKNISDRAAHTGYPGAGLAQITWKENYKLVSQATGIDFVNDPELMFNPSYALEAKAAFYKIHGMIHYILGKDFESAAGIYNAGNPRYRSTYTKAVANETKKWYPVFKEVEK